MDFTTCPELQPTPINIIYPAPPQTYAAHYLTLTHPQNANPATADPQSSVGTHELHGSIGVEPGVNPPSVDSFVPLSSDSGTHLGLEGYANFSYGHSQMVDTSSFMASTSGYYVDPNAQNWAAREAVRHYGADPVTYGADLVNYGASHGNGTWKKRQKKTKTRIVQSAYCEVCKIECTSKEVLEQHKSGKKHKKNLEKLREALGPVQVPPSASSNAVIGPQAQSDKSNSTSGNKSRRKAETPEDLEKKRRRVLEGGAAAEAVRICAVCNVVCNSETVFSYHLAGQKHAAMMKKQASEQTKCSAS